MNIKRAFLAAVAALMVPGFVMAQSTVTFDVGVTFDGLDDAAAAGLEVEATLSCNAGIPLTQSAMVGQATADRVTFSVTSFTPGSCDVNFAPVPYDGWAYEPGSGSCTGLVGGETCTANIVADEVQFSVNVGWMLGEDADDSVGATAEVTLSCMGTTNTTMVYPGGPTAPMPITMDVTPPSVCVASMDNVGSAVDVDNSDCEAGVTIDYGTDNSCDIYATIFFEGIPTLSQYGMAIMALLMLAVGFVGFRRFV
jgi:hypothetical protein